MTALISWLITGLVVALIIGFVLALISLCEIPLGERPRTRTFDRFGRVVGITENPDYHEQPGETPSPGDDWGS